VQHCHSVTLTLGDALGLALAAPRKSSHSVIHSDSHLMQHCRSVTLTLGDTLGLALGAVVSLGDTLGVPLGAALSFGDIHTR